MEYFSCSACWHSCRFFMHCLYPLAEGAQFFPDRFHCFRKIRHSKIIGRFCFDEPFLLWMKNSLLLSAGTILLAMLCAIPAAYAASRWRFRGRKSLLQALLVLNAFPQVLSLFALFLRAQDPPGLLNRHARVDPDLRRINVCICHMEYEGIFRYDPCRDRRGI